MFQECNSCIAMKAKTCMMNIVLLPDRKYLLLRVSKKKYSRWKLYPEKNYIVSFCGLHKG